MAEKKSTLYGGNGVQHGRRPPRTPARGWNRFPPERVRPAGGEEQCGKARSLFAGATRLFPSFPGQKRAVRRRGAARAWTCLEKDAVCRAAVKRGAELFPGGRCSAEEAGRAQAGRPQSFPLPEGPPFFPDKPLPEGAAAQGLPQGGVRRRAKRLFPSFPGGKRAKRGGRSNPQGASSGAFVFF